VTFGDNVFCRSVLDENSAYLTTADSAVQLAKNAAQKDVPSWAGVHYKAAFPVSKPPGANFYPRDMDKEVSYGTSLDMSDLMLHFSCVSFCLLGCLSFIFFCYCGYEDSIKPIAWCFNGRGHLATGSGFKLPLGVCQV